MYQGPSAALVAVHKNTNLVSQFSGNMMSYAPQVATFVDTPYNQGDTTVAVDAPTRSAPAGVMTDTKGRGSVFKLLIMLTGKHPAG